MYRERALPVTRRKWWENGVCVASPDRTLGFSRHFVRNKRSYKCVGMNHGCPIGSLSCFLCVRHFQVVPPLLC